MTFLELKNIHVRKNNQLFLHDISVAIKEGEYVALLGPTNSGKTSILNVIAGLLPITKGEIYAHDENITKLPPEDRNVGYVFENYNLFPHMTVMENLLFGVRMKNGDVALAKKEAREVLRIMHLEGRENAFPHELSGGMQQRVAIARAVVAGAKILLLDEPYRALDAKIREEMRFEIRRIVKSLGLTCIHATHEIEEAMIVADKIVVLNQGRIEQIATPQELFQKPASYYVATTIAEHNIYRITAQDTNEILEMQVLKGLRIKELVRQQEVNMNKESIKALRVLIKYSDVTFHPREPQKTYSIDPLSLEEPQVKDEQKHEAIGVITKIRLLGEYIRFTIQLTPESMSPAQLIQEVVAKKLLSLDLETAQELLNRQVTVIIPISKIMLYPEKKEASNQ